MSREPAFEDTNQELAETTADCCRPADHDLTVHDIDVDVRTFSALANETRYELLRYLAAADSAVCACELVPAMDVNQSTTSRALTALHRAGLVDRRKEGRWRYYEPTQRAARILTVMDADRSEPL